MAAEAEPPICPHCREHPQATVIDDHDRKIPIGSCGKCFGVKMTARIDEQLRCAICGESAYRPAGASGEYAILLDAGPYALCRSCHRHWTFEHSSMPQADYVELHRAERLAKAAQADKTRGERVCVK